MAHDNGANRCELTRDELLELKKADREELNAMSANDAQAAVESVLHPRQWQIENREQLSWPGDLADDG
ncbi:MAG: hypothetical protein H8E44_46340 [Planctomycetes bacterium]|nr:hypothetical protein [Planctomycetota bacterium]MBL7044277.1 hypothetical protein [Pirellulaceae bacterium]